MASVGRIVHFNRMGQHLAAIITGVAYSTIGGYSPLWLTVFPPNNEQPFSVIASEGDKPGEWHWMEYVPEIEVEIEFPDTSENDE